MAQITIQKGDTLSQIAQTQGTTVQELQNLNPNITDPNLIMAGATLNIPGTSPITQDQTVGIEQLSPTSPVQMPSPEAPQAAETFQTGLTAEVTTARTELEDRLRDERDRALRAQEELNKKLEQIQQESDPRKRETFEQEQEILQNQLRAAQTASETLEEDFTKRRSLVGELERLMTEGNALISRARNAPVSLSVLNKSVNRTIQDVQARAGVVQAVLSALDGNLAQAHNLINTAQGAVRAYWNDQVNYNNAYLNLVNSGSLAKEKINVDYANSQISLAERKLNDLERTANYINDLMIDPNSAQFIADAGVTLNDSVDEINEKIAEQSRKEEIKDVINDLTLEGFKHVPFVSSLFSFGQNRADAIALEVGGQTLYFVPPEEPVRGTPGIMEEGLDIKPGSMEDIWNQSAEAGDTIVAAAQRLIDEGYSPGEVRTFLSTNTNLTSGDRDVVMREVETSLPIPANTIASSMLAIDFNTALLKTRPGELKSAKSKVREKINNMTVGSQIRVGGQLVTITENIKNELLEAIDDIPETRDEANRILDLKEQLGL